MEFQILSMTCTSDKSESDLVLMPPPLQYCVYYSSALYYSAVSSCIHAAAYCLHLIPARSSNVPCSAKLTGVYALQYVDNEQAATMRHTGLAIIMVPAVVNSVAHIGKFVKNIEQVYKRNNGSSMIHENCQTQNLRFKDYFNSLNQKTDILCRTAV